MNLYAAGVRNISAPDDAAELIRHQRLLDDLTDDAIAALVQRLEWRQYPGAEHVLRRGDPPDGLGFVIAGRLRALIDGAVVGEIGQGDPLGETGPLTGRHRNADVVTVRDSLVAWLDRNDFEAIVSEHPRLALVLAKHALTRTATELRGRGVPTSVAVIAASPTVDTDSFCTLVAAAAGSATESSGGGGPTSPAPPRCATVIASTTDDATTSTLLGTYEHEGHQVLLPAAAGNDEQALWRIRQADRVWVLVDGSRPESYRAGACDEVKRVLHEAAAGGVTPAVEMVILHDASTKRPTRTAELLANLDVVGHHHLRRDDPAHVARFARHLQGRSVNLVLSGGGARGHAHLGVHRVLTQAGCPVDTLAGTSFGALIAAQLADEEDVDTLVRRNRRWIAARVGTSFSFVPVVSIMSIRRALQVFDELFGVRHLEDLWLPCLVVAVDLSDGSLRVIERGPLASMVRASGSPPGLWPPVPDGEGHLLVDGALVDNMPVHARRARTPGPVIAVDVSKTEDLVVSTGVGNVSGLSDFLRSIRSRSPFPTLPKLLMRAMTLAGATRLREAAELSDLVVQPEVSTITLPEHKRADEAIEAGEAAARAALAEHPGLVESWR
jgi:NTE family protein